MNIENTINLKIEFKAVGIKNNFKSEVLIFDEKKELINNGLYLKKNNRLIYINLELLEKYEFNYLTESNFETNTNIKIDRIKINNELNKMVNNNLSEIEIKEKMISIRSNIENEIFKIKRIYNDINIHIKV